MKKLLLLTWMLLIATMLFASGTAEQQNRIEREGRPKKGQREVVLLVTAMADLDEGLPRAQAVADFRAENPDVVLTTKHIDQSDGSTMTMDAMVAAGLAPDVYCDFLGRVSKYIVPEFALDLTPYMDDLDDYRDGVLEPFYRDGKLLGLPMPGGAQGMSLNVTMMREMGEPIPTDEEWTIARFLELAEKVKTFYNGERWVTGAFAANQSGDYLMWNWWASFGGTKFEGGDYSRTTANSEAGVKALEFLKLLHDRGYIEKEAPVLSDDDYAATWAQGKYLATAWFPSWSTHYWPTAIAQGLIDEPHEEVFIRFPNGAGLDKVPAATSYPGIVVHRGDDEEINKLAARMAWHLNKPSIQEMSIQRDEVHSNRKSVTAVVNKDGWRQIDEIVAKNGTMDLGLTHQSFSPIRVLLYPRLQDLWNGKQTPAEALKQYEAETNAMLAK
jgi:ABC-type glycerol-3-phosphate transport system substrate-binding protein